MASLLPKYPPLSADHIAGAKLFANRHDLIAGLPVPEQGVIAEIGVMRGDFSLHMLKTFKPKKFVAFDIFEAHQLPKIWDIPSTEFFGGLTQLECFKRLTSSFSEVVVTEQGLSKDTLPKYADHSFDLIYIDADHSYEIVKEDAAWASRMIKDSGILVFNDYIAYDHHAQIPYGIVPVVNTMVADQGWRVVGFCFNHDMFCDIAIQKDPGRFKEF